MAIQRQDNKQTTEPTTLKALQISGKALPKPKKLSPKSTQVVDKGDYITRRPESKYMQLSDLKGWDKNPRSIKDDRFNELKTRLARQGQIKPILITQNNVVIGGNMRLKAMRELGITEVWVSVTNATTDKEIFDLALTDNEEFGYYEKEQVANLALELGLSTLELQSYALSLGEPTTLDLLVDKFSPDIEEDEVPEVDEVNPPESVLGEVYQLGKHRLMCGSATEQGDVELLMDGKKAELALTDPPYGIGEAAGKNSSRGNLAVAKDYGNSSWDNAIPDKEAFDNVKTFSLNQIIFGGNYFVEYLRNSMCWIVWNKDNGTNDFADVELAWTSFNKAARLYKWTWNGMIRQGEKEDRVHPTQKPTGLIENILKDFSQQGNIVMDLFGGSGSVLIASQNTDRICYMLELEPKYCDVIRKRYAKHIGKEETWQESTPPVLLSVLA